MTISVLLCSAISSCCPCHDLKAGRSVQFSSPQFGCLGEMSIGKSSQHVPHSHGHVNRSKSTISISFVCFIISLLPWQLPVYQEMVTCSLLTVFVVNE